MAASFIARTNCFALESSGGFLALHPTQVGYRAGLAAFAATISYDIVQILQVAHVVRPPLDEILIYSTSLCIVVPFLVEMLALHHMARGQNRFWTHAAVTFAVIYAVFVSANYVVQLATVIPAKLNEAVLPIRVLDQTPHSMYWDYDAVGYIAMGFATLFAAQAMPRSGFGRLARWALCANTLVTPLIAIVYFYSRFSPALLFLGFPWAITAPLFMIALAMYLRQASSPLSAITTFSPTH
jgi:hypothetical protein